MNAYSFQEQMLRTSKSGLLKKYNELIGGVEGRGIDFENSIDSKGRLHMKHSFLDFYGHHEIEGLENQMLPLLLTCYFIADQYIFYRNDILKHVDLGFDGVKFTVVSDKLSGDDDKRQKMQQNLRYLIDPEGASNPIVLTRSPKSDLYPGDLITDNLAGWLNAAISDPTSEFAKRTVTLVSSYGSVGWAELLPSSINLERRSAILRLT